MSTINGVGGLDTARQEVSRASPSREIASGLSATIPTRLPALDALRGIAALAVVLYHVPQQIRDLAELPEWVLALFRNGALGVDAFFVLSGFVVSMSTANATWNVRYLGRFYLRRSIRLDPPYWIAIAFELVLGWIGVTYLTDASYDFPTIGSILAHVVYLQELLGYSHVSDVFWTLCFEIQLYLALVGLLVIAHDPFIVRRISSRTLISATVVVLSLWSVCIRNEWFPNPMSGLALIRAFQFSIGAMSFAAASGRASATHVLWFIASLAVLRTLGGGFADMSVTLLAAAFCSLAHHSSRVNELFRRDALQYLGKISYSLYLFHASIVGRFSAVSLIVLGTSLAPEWYVISILCSIGASVLVAAVVHHLIESPVHRFSRRIAL